MAALDIPIQLVGACSTLERHDAVVVSGMRNGNTQLLQLRLEVVSSRKKDADGLYQLYYCWAAAERAGWLIELRCESTHKWSLFRTLSWEDGQEGKMEELWYHVDVNSAFLSWALL